MRLTKDIRILQLFLSEQHYFAVFNGGILSRRLPQRDHLREVCFAKLFDVQPACAYACERVCTASKGCER